MQITKATDAGLRVLMVLANDSPQMRANVPELAERLGVPRHHLAKVVQQLAKQGWVTTRRGRTGGLAITDAGRATNATEVLKALEGADPVVDCFDPICPLVSPGCRLQSLLDEAHRAFLDVLSTQTIEELAGA